MSATTGITRQQEQQLYEFLRTEVEDDALRYEIIAKKIQRAADGVASDYDLSIVASWLHAMVSEHLINSSVVHQKAVCKEPFADVRAGKVGNPLYQYFIDTLEQSELDAISNNAPYFVWHSQRSAEATALKKSPAVHMKEWSQAHLSDRVRHQREAQQSEQKTVRVWDGFSTREIPMSGTYEQIRNVCAGYPPGHIWSIH